MARYEDTVGNIYITITECDCGLTGGCDKCRPIVIRKDDLLRDKSHREFGEAWEELPKIVD